MATTKFSKYQYRSAIQDKGMSIEEIAEELTEDEIDFDEVSMAETKRIDLDV